MAASSNPASRLRQPELQDLRTIRASALGALLAEESATWQDSLDWDFGHSANLVRKFVDIRALNGFALVVAEQVVGYSYFVFEDRKGLIGDLYVMKEFRNQESELRLLRASLEELMKTTDLHRIESQLMTFDGPLPRDNAYLRVFERDFLSARLPAAFALQERPLFGKISIAPWQDQYQEGAAQLIASAYQGHVDSLINDQYRSVSGSRKFLFNIVQYPGCGTFFPGASLIAFDHEKGTLAGICLASMVAAGSGHITQICVGRDWQGRGLGYELLRRSMQLLREQDVRKVSLTVTSENEQALRMYLRMGFVKTRHFAAYVWEDF